MIDEKGLAREMKREYKAAGYTVVDHGGELSIYCDMWYVRCDKTKLPRKILALLAEHMGLLTAYGDALLIRKDEDPQTLLSHLVGEEIGDWVETDELEELWWTPIQYGAVRILQNVDTKKCYGVEVATLSIVDFAVHRSESVVIMKTGAACWQHPGEQVMLRTTEKSKYDGKMAACVWQALESVNLNGKQPEAEA